MQLEPAELIDRGRAIYDSFIPAGLSTQRDLFSDDVVWHVPGRNPVAGRYEDKDDFFGTMAQRMAPLESWDYKLRDMYTNEGAQALLAEFQLSGRRRGIAIATRGFHMIRFDSEGRIIEGWGFVKEQDQVDGFFRA